MIAMLKNWLKLLRAENLLLIILTQYLVRYALFEAFGIAVSLSDFQYLLLCLSTLCLAAGGNLINDVFDLETDRINKPQRPIASGKISVKQAETSYMVLTIIGVGTGFYLSNFIDKPMFAAIFIIVAALLYLYASYFKQVLILGNLIISSLVALVIIIPGIFDLIPAIDVFNRPTQRVIFSILLDYAWFAFFLNWLREMVKDQEDITGDYNTGRNSLPIALGISRTNKVIFALGIIPLASVIYYTFEYLYENSIAVLYALFFVAGPLIYFLGNIWNAQTGKDYARLSRVLKLIMFLGLMSLGLYPLILL